MILIPVLLTGSCRHSPLPEHITRFPIPGASEQPPRRPLRRSHPLAIFHGFDLWPRKNDVNATTSRSFSLLPPEDEGTFKIESGEDIFTPEEDDGSSGDQTWFTMQARIPITDVNIDVNPDTHQWAGAAVLRPTASSPLITTEHTLAINLNCVYTFEDGAQAKEPLRFVIPLRFANIAPPPPAAAIPFSTTPRAGRSHALSLPTSSVYAQSLPVYSQLFYSNGDRKLDQTPLPLYTAQDENTELPPLISYAKLYGQRGDSYSDNDSETASLLS